MAQSLAQKLAQLAIPLVATSLLASCASDGFDDSFGKPVPGIGEVKRLPPYDPFGTGEQDDDDEDAGEPAPQGLGARPQPQDPAVSEGQNTVAKDKLAVLTPPETGPETPSAPVDAPANLSPFSGLTAAQLKTQWGAPSLTRNEAGAQLMQFKGKGCVVLAYLYPSDGGEMQTTFAEAHPGGDSASAISSCLGKAARPREVQAPQNGRKPALAVKPD
jgi:hypothetical protein